MAERGLTVTVGGESFTVGLSAAPLTIGRAPTAGLSLVSPSLSWLHASVRVQAGQIWVRDLNSTNGVSIDGARIQGEAELPDGSIAQLGGGVALQASAAPTADRRATTVIEDLRRGRRFALTVGRNPLAALEIAERGEIVLTASGAISLVLEDQLHAVEPGETCLVDEARFRIVELVPVGTVGRYEEPFPYRLTVRLNSPRGPEAIVVDRQSQKQAVITSEYRVSLLYLLARQVTDDMAAGKAEADLGWCDDGQLAIGLWGRERKSASAFPVTVHRLRKELNDAGLDDAFLEKGRKILRSRLIDVRVE